VLNLILTFPLKRWHAPQHYQNIAIENDGLAGESMASNTVTNWFGNIVSHPSVIVDAKSVEDIVAVMKDPVLPWCKKPLETDGRLSQRHGNSLIRTIAY
jgi:hypothetical protein